MAYKPEGVDAADPTRWILEGMGIMDNQMLRPTISQIEHILNVASEMDWANPTVAYLCRFHAFEISHTLNPTSDGDGVRAFKTALLHRIEREEAATLAQKKNAPHEIKTFYRYYCEKYIQGLQNADKPDRALLTKAHQTAAVLFEVVKCVCKKVPLEILELHEQVAKNAEIYNILPLDTGSSNQGLLKHPEPNHLKIPLEAIKNCTQDFNERNYVGKGGYGRVYKGILSWADHVNRLVAVKRLDVTGFQGNKEFHTELTMLSQYRHQNIITLIGFCDDTNEMILVYEFATHGSLDKYLSNRALSAGAGPSWPQLLKICIDVASALGYLHNHVAVKHRIIHRDIKSSNILLDDKWNAKLADFGLARIGLANQENTFVITNPGGTYGYCDPQYERTGFLTKESDVYSFGVVLFEVLCGRLACVIDYHDKRRFLNHLARTCYENGELDKIIDHRIKKDIKPRTLHKFSAIAYQCLQETREERPTIAEVALQLKDALKIQLEDEIVQDEVTMQHDTSSKTTS